MVKMSRRDRPSAKEEIRSWSTEYLQKFLTAHGLGECNEAIRKRDVDGEAFLSLTEVQLSLWKRDLTLPTIRRLACFVQEVNTQPEKYLQTDSGIVDHGEGSTSDMPHGISNKQGAFSLSHECQSPSDWWGSDFSDDEDSSGAVGVNCTVAAEDETEAVYCNSDALESEEVYSNSEVLENEETYYNSGIMEKPPVPSRPPALVPKPAPTTLAPNNTSNLPKRAPTTLAHNNTSNLPKPAPTTLAHNNTSNIPKPAPTTLAHNNTFNLPKPAPTTLAHNNTSNLPKPAPTTLAQNNTSNPTKSVPTTLAHSNTSNLPKPAPATLAHNNTSNLPKPAHTTLAHSNTSNSPKPVPTTLAHNNTNLPKPAPTTLAHNNTSNLPKPAPTTLAHNNTSNLPKPVPTTLAHNNTNLPKPAPTTLAHNNTSNLPKPAPTTLAHNNTSNLPKPPVPAESIKSLVSNFHLLETTHQFDEEVYESVDKEVPVSNSVSLAELLKKSLEERAKAAAIKQSVPSSRRNKQAMQNIPPQTGATAETAWNLPTLPQQKDELCAFEADADKGYDSEEYESITETGQSAHLPPGDGTEDYMQPIQEHQQQGTEVAPPLPPKTWSKPAIATLPSKKPPSPPRIKLDDSPSSPGSSGDGVTGLLSGIFKKKRGTGTAGAQDSRERLPTPEVKKVTPFPPSSHKLTTVDALPSTQRPLPPTPGDKPTVVGLHRVPQQPWYHDVDRRQAEEMLCNGDDGAFLVRPSTKNPMTLTLWYKRQPYNISIRQRSDRRYALGTEKANEQSFASVEELVQNYQTEKLVLYRGGEKAGRTLLTTSPPHGYQHIM